MPHARADASTDWSHAEPRSRKREPRCLSSPTDLDRSDGGSLARTLKSRGRHRQRIAAPSEECAQVDVARGVHRDEAVARHARSRGLPAGSIEEPPNASSEAACRDQLLTRPVVAFAFVARTFAPFARIGACARGGMLRK